MNAPTRIIVAGDRAWDCNALAERLLEQLVAEHGEIVIVHGDSSGVDWAFKRAARLKGIGHEPHTADMALFRVDKDKLDRDAESRRNQAMVDAGAAKCLVVHRFLPNSKKTLDVARRCFDAGIPVYVVNSDRAQPERLEEVPR